MMLVRRLLSSKTTRALAFGVRFSVSSAASQPSFSIARAYSDEAMEINLGQ
jgi:hypothetical protein